MRRLTRNMALILLLPLVYASLATRDARIVSDIVHIGPSVNVSRDLPFDPHYEVEVAANPADARQLVACSMLYPNNSPTSEVVTYASFDGGKTWELTLRTKGEDLYPSWDPDCQYGPDKITYSLSEGWGPHDASERHHRQAYNRIDRSRDGGRTWDGPLRTFHSERAFLTVDHNAGPQRGWWYIYGQASFKFLLLPDSHADGIRVDWSPDQGQTVFHQWAPKKEGEHSVGPGPGAVLSDGTLVFPVTAMDDPLRSQNGFIEIIRATFQRANWPLDIETLTPGKWPVHLASGSSWFPKLAVDSGDGPFRGRLYVIWIDGTSGHSEVKLSFSVDKGKTWSRPRVINDESEVQIRHSSSGLDDIHGLVAVNKHGVVGVTWLDRRNYPGNLGWTVKFRASLDGAETFLPSVKVPGPDYDPTRNGVIFVGPTFYYPPDEAHSTNALDVDRFSFNGGDTMGLAVDAEGEFHPVWVANPTGVPQLWTTYIAVRGKAEENGSPELSGLKDASKFIRLEFTKRRYDRASHALEFDLQLENIGESSISSPVKVRLLDIASPVGAMTVKVGDLETIAEGAVLDFNSLLRGDTLRPGEMTRPNHVSLYVHGTDSFPFILPLPLTGASANLALLSTKVLTGAIQAQQKGDNHSSNGVSPTE